MGNETKRIAAAWRMAGALIARHGDDVYLIGGLKEPCDFAENGFEDPGEIDPLERPYVRLRATGEVRTTTPCLEIDCINGETLAATLANRMLIRRNGSVSNRLWNVICDAKENEKHDRIDATWLVSMPESIWEIVRDTVLRC